MSKRWLIALLLISFSFNLAVMGSVLYLHYSMPCKMPPPKPNEGFMPGPPPEHRMPRLDDPETRELRNKFDDTKVILMQELANDPVNETRVKTIIDSSLIIQNDLEHKLGEKILAYRKTLNAEEAREHFLRRAEHLKKRSREIHKTKIRRRS